jgi:hypothetical protein
LLAIADATSAHAYLDAQDRALPAAEAQYEELVSMARSNSNPTVRREALGLVFLAERPDAEEVLLASTKGDPDPRVAEFAKGLLFRATVARHARNSGKMTDEQYGKYKVISREMHAKALFPADRSTKR